MARPRKDGLDYFPLDVNFLSDLKIKKIIRTYGAQAVAVVMSVLTMVYRDNGYFATYDDDLVFIIADELKLEDGYVKDVIEKMIEVEFLDKKQKEENKILTSIGIQERYLKACERRVKTTLNATYNLLNDSSNELPQTESTDKEGFCRQKSHSTVVNDSKSTQSKVKERKEKDSKEKESKLINISNAEKDKIINEQFEALWKMYPRKERKNDALKAYKKAIKKGIDPLIIKKGIVEYKNYLEVNKTQPEYVAQGGTWFNQERWNDDYSYLKANGLNFVNNTNASTKVPMVHWTANKR